MYFSRRVGSNYYGVTLVAYGSPDVKLEAINSGGFYLAPAKATATAGIVHDVEYTVRIRRMQRHVEFEVWDGATKLCASSYDSTSDFGDGAFGLLTFYAGATFDDFSFTRLDQIHAPAVPRLVATGKTSLNTCTTCGP